MAEIIALLANSVITIVFLSYIFLLWVALIFWSGMDIRSRSDNWWVRIGSIFLVGMGFIFGFVLYLILRPSVTIEDEKMHELEEKLMEFQSKTFACPSCSQIVREDFLFCASCGFPVKRECFSCKRVLEVVWNQCPYCGAVVGQPLLPPVREVPEVKVGGNSFLNLMKKLFIAPAATPSEVKRGRGRPRKNPLEAKYSANGSKYENSQPKRGRGRPRKTPVATA